MKFTPLDIQRREFEKAFRGVNDGEVRAFLHEVAGEWEELQQENARMRTEIVDIREHLHQYQDQDRIFRETLLHAQKTKEEILETVNREKAIILKEADFKADELIRAAQTHVADLESQVRSLKLERVRLLQDLDSLVSRSRRFLMEEAPDMFPGGDHPRRPEEPELARAQAPAGPMGPQPQPPRVPQAFLRKPSE